MFYPKYFPEVLWELWFRGKILFQKAEISWANKFFLDAIHLKQNPDNIFPILSEAKDLKNC